MIDNITGSAATRLSCWPMMLRRSPRRRAAPTSTVSLGRAPWGERRTGAGPVAVVHPARTSPERVTCAPIGVMGEMQAFGEGALRLRGGMRVDGEGREARAVRMRTAAWLFVWCLLAHGGGAPAYSQTDSVGTPQRVSRGNPFRVRIVGTTNTQAVLTYSAPDSGACTVKVSQQSSLTPLVHDVDPNLFPGSDQDTRPESITAQNSRIFVAGKRVTERAADGKNYSRALEAYAIHYYQVTCGSVVMSGTFSTANIPFGMTYQDLPQLDPTNPGATITPTLLNDRTQTIVDPHTGALIRRVSLPADTNYPASGSGGTGPFMYFGGFTRVCSEVLVGPAPGYLCSFAEGNGGYGILYYIIPSTGEARYLGYNSWGAAYPFINPTDGKFYGQSGSSLLAYTYSGDYSANSPNSAASFASTTLIADVPAAIHTFDSNFSTSDFSCGIGTAIGDYLQFLCRRGTQDTYGRVAAIRISTASIVGAVPVWKNPRTAWCTIHSGAPLYSAPVIYIGTHQAVGSPALGAGPYTTAYSGGSTLSIGSTSLAVSGEPSCSGCGADSALPIAAAGDIYTFSDNPETVTLVTKNSPTSWTISATVNTHASGTALTANCSYSPVFWKFLDDPRS